MVQDSEPLDHRTADGPECRSSAVQALGGAQAYDTATLGYEAADPSLQTPLWCEAMQGSPHAREGR